MSSGISGRMAISRTCIVAPYSPPNRGPADTNTRTSKWPPHGALTPDSKESWKRPVNPTSVNTHPKEHGHGYNYAGIPFGCRTVGSVFSRDACERATSGAPQASSTPVIYLNQGWSQERPRVVLSFLARLGGH